MDRSRPWNKLQPQIRTTKDRKGTKTYFVRFVSFVVQNVREPGWRRHAPGREQAGCGI